MIIALQNSRLISSRFLRSAFRQNFLKLLCIRKHHQNQDSWDYEDKSCSPDPGPIWLVKEWKEALITSITTVLMANFSLPSLDFPLMLKEGIIANNISRLVNNISQQCYYILCFSNYNNYILQVVSRKDRPIFLLLELSAAFETTDHEMLLTRLNMQRGVIGTVLVQWFQSCRNCCREFSLQWDSLGGGGCGGRKSVKKKPGIP